MSKSSAKYYQKRQQNTLVKGIKFFPKEEKERKRHYEIANDVSLLEHEKERLIEYRKIYLKMWKNALQQCSQKQNILSLVHKQGFILDKIKESKSFIEIVKDLGISKSTIFFKVNFYKMIKKLK